MEIKPIATISTDFDNKFGVPRQSALIDELKGKIYFEKEFACKEAVRGLEEFSHIWLIWQFSESMTDKFNPTVRPPRLGGNTRMGVFATRSPFRPNNLGLSCVKLEKIEYTKQGHPILEVSGVDLINGTPIFDIKPYISYSDCHENAVSGFADENKDYSLNVNISDDLLTKIDKTKQQALIKILESDPRPSYQNDESRIYGFGFAGYEIKFKVAKNELEVTNIVKKEEK